MIHVISLQSSRARPRRTQYLRAGSTFAGVVGCRAPASESVATSRLEQRQDLAGLDVGALLVTSQLPAVYLDRALQQSLQRPVRRLKFQNLSHAGAAPVVVNSVRRGSEIDTRSSHVGGKISHAEGSAHDR